MISFYGAPMLIVMTFSGANVENWLEKPHKFEIKEVPYGVAASQVTSSDRYTAIDTKNLV